jgi:hypothetical protein
MFANIKVRICGQSATSGEFLTSDVTCDVTFVVHLVRLSMNRRCSRHETAMFALNQNINDGLDHFLTAVSRKGDEQLSAADHISLTMPFHFSDNSQI